MARRESFGPYRRAVRALNAAGSPFLVGGAWALREHTMVRRASKDFDLFLEHSELERASAALEADGFAITHFAPHWLTKAKRDRRTVDLIFASGNGVAVVDGEWFEHAIEGEILGLPVRLCPVEEMIWSKSFIMERERFDGSEVAHLLHARAARMDWPRLLRRFGENWPVLLSHLVLFGYIYPDRADSIPEWVLEDLLDRLRHGRGNEENGVCRGTLLSRIQYQVDLEQYGYRDGRLPPTGRMNAADAASWTDKGIRDDQG